MSTKKEHRLVIKLQKTLDNQREHAELLLKRWLKKDFVKLELDKMNKLPEIKNE
jgi:hypothetical protein